MPTDEVYGTYLGYINIGGIRYWDARDFEGYEIIMSEQKLDSDWQHREDLKMLMEDRI